MRRASMTWAKSKCAFSRRGEKCFSPTRGMAFSSSTDPYQVYSTIGVLLVYCNCSMSRSWAITIRSVDRVIHVSYRRHGHVSRAPLDFTYPHTLDTPFPPGLLSSLNNLMRNTCVGWPARLARIQNILGTDDSTRRIPRFSAMF